METFNFLKNHARCRGKLMKFQIFYSLFVVVVFFVVPFCCCPFFIIFFLVFSIMLGHHVVWTRQQGVCRKAKLQASVF